MSIQYLNSLDKTEEAELGIWKESLKKARPTGSPKGPGGPGVLLSSPG